MSYTEFMQALASGVVAGCLWGILAIGFGLILGVSGRFHFAFATTFVLAVYVTDRLTSSGVGLYLAILIAIGAAIVLGVLLEIVLYAPLVARAGASGLLAVFVTSLGVVIVGENLIRLIWGSETVTLPTGYDVSRVSFGHGVGVTNQSVVIVAVALVVAFGSWAFLRWFKYGRAIRATQENPDMARAVGVRPENVYIFVFAVGSALSAIGGILYTQQGSAAPDSGLQPTFTALVAMFLAGLRSSPLGFLGAGLAIGIIQNLAVIWIGSLWSPVVTFGILFVYIALTPVLERHTIRIPRPRSSRPAIAES
jgi:branched-chain amino acid transport system permease protein